MISFDSAAVVAPDGTEILRPITLTLTEPRVSIVGANGSGKSTLARLINGLIEPTTGSVRINDLYTVRDGAEVRKAVGFVFTDPAAQLIMPTVIEDVELSLRRTHKYPRDRRTAAIAALERFGLEALAERSVHTLSGGQKQLLAIATVLSTSPATLVADEPTTLLDLHNSMRIGDLLMSLAQQVIVVTHDLELAARADRTLVVADGSIIFDGDPAEAIAHYRASVTQ
ncbi:energy-coupling factor ABC transporter ATP-binding protein [Leucobacter denitrificans]|uniref:ABC transporter ATP-binding protein n=1 Tax=Leucobacter denitrificans TaxID=683042 RepID=A0A7G9S2I0_9MICO|nr:ABC transporter ATP-binding protein [Leucobacter denitrificans]QNN62055.1 ABC transporter ATP-binding protein [Leucobacter denitrificans]